MCDAWIAFVNMYFFFLSSQFHLFPALYKDKPCPKCPHRGAVGTLYRINVLTYPKTNAMPQRKICMRNSFASGSLDEQLVLISGNLSLKMLIKSGHKMLWFTWVSQRSRRFTPFDQIKTHWAEKVDLINHTDEKYLAAVKSEISLDS